MQRMEKISVIVPIFNGEKYVKNCLEMLLSQRDDIYEIILINDGSTDSTEEIILNFSSEKKIKYYSQTNMGVSEARNQGIRLATGDWIVFCDVDDEVSKGFFDDISSSVSGRDTDLICYAKSAVGLKDKDCGFTSITGKDAVFSIFGEKSFDNSQDFLMMAVWSKAFRRSVILENNISFDKRLSFGEDTIFMFDYVDKCGKIDCIHRGYYSYIQNENSACKIGGKESDYFGLLFLIEKLETLFLADEGNRKDLLWLEALDRFVYKMGEIYIGRYRRGSLKVSARERSKKVRTMCKSIRKYSKGVSIKKRIKNELICCFPRMYLRMVKR